MIETRKFIDTNILVYAFDTTDAKKNNTAKKIVSRAWQGEVTYFISNQVLAEFSRAITQKVNNPYTNSEAVDILQTFKIKEWIILNYSLKTITSALELIQKHKCSFWDAIIIATALENNINEIYSENCGMAQEFGIKVTNPFKNSIIS